MDFLKPSPSGYFSMENYMEYDCKQLRFRVLGDKGYYEPMGGGEGEVGSPDKERKYPSPNGASNAIMRLLCDYAKNSVDYRGCIRRDYTQLCNQTTSESRIPDATIID